MIPEGLQRARRRIPGIPLLASILLLLAFPALASAATRYAEPGGNGPAASCPQADPCDVEDAVEDGSVAAGDVVIVLGGSYNLGSGSLAVTKSITLRGPAPGQRPSITGSGITTLDLVAAGSTVTDLSLAGTGGGGTTVLRSNGGVTIERVSAQTTTAGIACLVRGNSGQARIRDTICSTSAPAGGALYASATGPNDYAAIRTSNVTAVSTAGTAVVANASGDNSLASIFAFNTIAFGCPDCNDIAAFNSGAGSETGILTSASNYDRAAAAGDNSTILEFGDNRTALPVFRDPANRDYHQAPTSPTVGAGINPPLGSSDPADRPGFFDIDGEARTQNKVDMGADELPASQELPDGDADDDDVPDSIDNCPFVSNNEQEDDDGDGVGDRCDSDSGPGSKGKIADLDVTAKKTQKQKGKIKIKLSAGAAEQITLKGKGSIQVKGQKKGYKLQPQTKVVEAGERVILPLKLKKNKDAKKVKQAIKRYKKAPKKKKPKVAVKARVQAVATDAAGNRLAEKRVVRLR